MGSYVVAVDVGTGSARAGVFDRDGRLLGRSVHRIAMLREDGWTAAHSSADIWQAVSSSIRAAIEIAAIEPALVDAIGFDATCSLTFLDKDGRSLSIALNGQPDWDTIAWLDHRATVEADELSRVECEAVVRSGERLSPEMQLPKIAWVRKQLPEIWRNTAFVLDLADFLTFRATGSAKRALCTLATKWNFDRNKPDGWDEILLASAGLGQLARKAGISGAPAETGTPIGTLSEKAANELGLKPGIFVAAGLVDAYAGALALIGGQPERNGDAALIGGTSSCLMRFQQKPLPVSSFWGPFFGASLPGYWIIEGGQSAAGALLDHIVQLHLNREATSADHERIFKRINMLLGENRDDLAPHIHVLPDFHGNRSPFGDPLLHGVVHGLTLDRSFDALVSVYYRAMVGLALGMRQIVEKLEEQDRPIARLHLGGGHARDPLFAQLYADALAREIVIGPGEDAMLLGSAINAATAAGWFESVETAAYAFQRPEHIIIPDPSASLRMERDYTIFQRMQAHRREIIDLIIP